MLWRDVLMSFLEARLGNPPDNVEYVELDAAQALETTFPLITDLVARFSDDDAQEPFPDAVEEEADRWIAEAARAGKLKRLRKAPTEAARAIARRALNVGAMLRLEEKMNNGWVTVPLPTLLSKDDLAVAALLYLLAGPGRPDPRLAPADSLRVRH